MQDIKRKQRAEILAKDKNISSEIFRRVQKQSNITYNTQVEQSNSINAEDETTGNDLSSALNTVLEAKVYDLEILVKGALAPTGASADATIKRLLMNNDFISAFNKLVKFTNSIGKNQQTKEFLDKLVFKSEDLLNACVFGYKEIFEDKFSKTGKLSKLIYQVFQAYALYSYAQSMIKRKNLRPIAENEYNMYLNEMFLNLPQKTKDQILKENKSSTANFFTKVGYDKALEERAKEIRNNTNRPMSQKEEEEFRMLFLTKIAPQLKLDVNTASKVKAIDRVQKDYNTYQAQQLQHLQNMPPPPPPLPPAPQTPAPQMPSITPEQIDRILQGEVDGLAKSIQEEIIKHIPKGGRISNNFVKLTIRPIFTKMITEFSNNFRIQYPTVTADQVDNFYRLVFTKVQTYFNVKI